MTVSLYGKHITTEWSSRLDLVHMAINYMMLANEGQFVYTTIQWPAWSNMIIDYWTAAALKYPG